MKVLSWAGCVIGFVVFASHAGTAQNIADVSRETEQKVVSTTLPSGEPIRMYALRIERNWEASTTHLKGNVRVMIRESVKAGDRFVVIRADEASFDEKSGELIPLGNVRVSQEVH